MLLIGVLVLLALIAAVNGTAGNVAIHVLGWSLVLWCVFALIPRKRKPRRRD